MNIRNFSEWYTGNLDWLQDGTIFMCLGGSHAYGTNVPESDTDYRGIAIAPKSYYLGNIHHFESMDQKVPDVQIYDIKQFFELASKCNPNIIELLFTDESDWIIPKDTPWGSDSWAYGCWNAIYCNRNLFLSKSARDRYSGYAMSQLSRIKSHRQFILNPPKGQPQRKDYGLPDAPTIEKEQFNIVESKIKKVEDQLGGEGFSHDKVEELDIQLVTNAIKETDLNINLIPIFLAERRYRSAMRQWGQFLKWKAERNPKRAALEAKFGYDTKHAMHLVRLLNMAKEILSEGKVLVKRPDAEFLKDIRNGVWSYDELMLWARKTERELDTAYANSKLPKEADRVKIDNILIEILERSIG